GRRASGRNPADTARARAGRRHGRVRRHAGRPSLCAVRAVLDTARDDAGPPAGAGGRPRARFAGRRRGHAGRAGASRQRAASRLRPRGGTVCQGPPRRRRLGGMGGAPVGGGIAPGVKLDLAPRGVRIDASALGLASASEPLPQSLELVVGDGGPISVPVDAAGTAAAPFQLRGADGRYWLVDPASAGTADVEVQLTATPHFYGRRTSSGGPLPPIPNPL